MVEIAEMNRRLAALRPAACLPDFAVSLNNLGWGRHTEDSLPVFREAIEIYRRLMQTDGTEKHAGGLYATLGNLGGALESLGRTEEARAAIQEAVDVFRQIPSAPAGTEIAFTLHRLGRLNGRLERNEEALQATREAAEIYRRKVVELPTADMLRSWYVETLIDLAALLRTMGRQDEALATAEEAVAEARSPSRIATGRNLERSLQLLAEVLADLGHDDEARAVAEEAAELERRAANR
jgi:tetratricopeptide (TPR) repeat protein